MKTKNAFLTIAMAILLVTTGLAQNRAVLLHESFDGNSLPNGWSVQGEGPNNGAVSNTNEAREATAKLTIL